MKIKRICQALGATVFIIFGWGYILSNAIDGERTYQARASLEECR